MLLFASSSTPGCATNQPNISPSSKYCLQSSYAFSMFHHRSRIHCRPASSRASESHHICIHIPHPRSFAYLLREMPRSVRPSPYHKAVGKSIYIVLHINFRAVTHVSNLTNIFGICLSMLYILLDSINFCRKPVRSPGFF